MSDHLSSAVRVLLIRFSVGLYQMTCSGRHLNVPLRQEAVSSVLTDVV